LKVVLTGSRGNLARAIITKADWQVVPLNREDWSDLDGLCSGASGGLRDGAMVDAIIHAAFDVQGAFGRDPMSFVESNVLATARLLSAARDHGISRFFYVSSAAVYGHERSPEARRVIAPATLYGLIKLLNERLVRSFCEDAGISFTTFRLFNLFGGDDRFSVIHRLDRAVGGKEPFVLNNGGNDWRDFIHVDDAARIIVAVVNSGRFPGEIDVGTGCATRIADIVDFVRQVAPSVQIFHANTQPGAAFSCADISLIRDIAGDDFVSLPAWLAGRYGLPGSGFGDSSRRQSAG